LAGGQTLPVQHHAGRTYFHAPVLPALGWMVAAWSEGPASQDQPTARISGSERDVKALETRFYRIEFDDEGNLGRLYDRANDHQVLAAAGNRFQVFEDDPGVKFSAWDIAYHFEEYEYTVKQTSPWRLVANGPLFAVLASSWQVLESTIEQEMWLYAGDPRIDFRTRVEWFDERKLLKVGFPLLVRARTATYDLPFGHIDRPTHRNTSWEQAKFEVCGHKWVDLSEGDYGVALLNDSKYGHDVHDNLVRLSLLRSPVRPDSACDQGLHEFTYSLLPHAGGWRQAQVDRRGYELNVPPLVTGLVRGQERSHVQLPATYSLLNVDSDSIIVEALKQAEDGHGLVLRTYDSHGCRAPVPLDFALELEAAAETDLLEENGQAVDTEGCRIEARYGPYEIKTHRLVFSDQQPGPPAGGPSGSEKS
jgi:alpha-mannosidase